MLFRSLAALDAYEVIAVLAGALERSPLKLDRSTRNAIKKARASLGEKAFNLAAARGSRFDPAEARRYVIEVWRGIVADRAQSNAAD